MRVAVYTAITGGWDNLKPPRQCPGVDFVCFSDASLRAPGWDVRLIQDVESSPRRTARRYKLLSHIYLPRYDAVVWVDGSFAVVGDMKRAAKIFLSKHSIAVRRHPWRNPPCAYAEAEACLEQGKDEPGLIRRQMERYRAEGYPEAHGMVDTAFLLRRHDEDGKRFNEAWWAELSRDSLRDQLSFNYTSWKTGILWRAMPNKAHRSDEFVSYRGHGQRP